MRAAMVEVQLGRHLECMRALWPNLFEARSLATEANEVHSTLQSLISSVRALSTGDGADSCARREQAAWIEEFICKVTPFLERTAVQRKSATEFLKNPAVALPAASST